jgi:hypothetical protein
VPVIVTLKVPIGALRPVLSVRLEVPDPPEVRTIEEELREALRLPEEVDAESRIVPEKPLRLVRVIVLVADEPRIKLTDDGFAEIEKSPVEVPDETVNDMVVE